MIMCAVPIPVLNFTATAQMLQYICMNSCLNFCNILGCCCSVCVHALVMPYSLFPAPWTTLLMPLHQCCLWETPISVHSWLTVLGINELLVVFGHILHMEHWQLTTSHCCYLPCCTAHGQLLVYHVHSLAITCKWPCSWKSKNCFHLNSFHSQ
jgi:hypothetical protein